MLQIDPQISPLAISRLNQPTSFSLPSTCHGPSPDHINSPTLASLQSVSYTGGNGETPTVDTNNTAVFPSKEQGFYGGRLASGFPFLLIDTYK